MRDQYSWFLSYVKPYRVQLCLVLLFSLASTALTLSYPFFTSMLIDDVLIRQTRPLAAVLGLAFGSMILGYFISVGNSLLYLHITLNMLRRVRLDLFKRVQRAEYSRLTRTKAGDIITRLNGDTAEVQGGMTDIILQAIIQSSTLLFVSGMMIWLDAKLAMVCMSLIPFFIGAVRYFRPKIVELSTHMRQQHSTLQSFLIERLHGIKLIKQLAAEEQTASSFDQQIQRINQQSFQYSWVSTLAEGIPRLTVIVSSMAIFGWGGYMVLHGAITVGTLVAFTSYQARLYGPVQSLAALYMRLQRMNVSLDRLEELTNLPLETEQPQIIEEKIGLMTAPLLQLKEVSFQFRRNQTVLDRIDARMQSGEAVALLGESGQGKSTLVDVVTGFYQPLTGEIRLKGGNLAQLSLAERRSRIAIAGQQPLLFHETILENIRLARPDASLGEVVQAAKLACIHEEVMKLPQGYETIIGENGANLSGGQRQRLALARTLVRRADLYIFDEATSEVDERTEQMIYEHLMRESPRRSMIIISHRPASLNWVNQHWTLNNGQLTVFYRVETSVAGEG